jgi:hypothetical protein
MAVLCGFPSAGEPPARTCKLPELGFRSRHPLRHHCAHYTKYTNSYHEGFQHYMRPAFVFVLRAADSAIVRIYLCNY